MLYTQPQIRFMALDSTESSVMLHYSIHRGIDAPEGMDAATALRGLLEPLTGCVFVQQSVVYPAINPTRPAPAGDSSSSRVGVFVFATSDPIEYAIIELAGIKDSFLLQTGPGAGLLINRDDPTVKAFVDELIDGQWYSPFGFKIAALEAAFLQIRP